MRQLEVDKNQGYISREQLLIINQLVQAIPNIEERKQYLVDLGDVYERLLRDEAIYIDERDYNIYSIIRVGYYEWLGENLRFIAPRSKWTNDHFPNLFYGRLYDWSTVMGVDIDYNEQQLNKATPVQGIAPKGWYIPSEEDWKALMTFYKKKRSDLGRYMQELKQGHFNALLAGSYAEGKFRNLDKIGYYWSSTETADQAALYCSIYKTVLDKMFTGPHFKRMTYACRCVRKVK